MSGPKTTWPTRSLLLTCSLCSIIMAVLAVAGWISDNLLLASFGTDIIPMAPSTAVSFIVLHASLLAVTLRPRSTTAQGFALVVALFLLFTGGTVIARTVSGAGLGLDHLITGGETRTLSGSPIGLMSPLTALGFCLSSLSLLLLVRSRSRVGQIAACVSAVVIFFFGAFLILGYLFGVPPLYGTSIIPVSLTTAIVFLLSGFSLTLGPPRTSGVLRAPCGESPISRLLGLAIILIMGGYFFYYSQNTHFRQEKFNELAAVGHLKTDQILQWYDDRIADATIMAESPFFSKAVGQWLAGNNQPYRDIVNRMGLTKKNYGYEDIFLTSPEGILRVTVAGVQEIDPATVELCRKASREKRVIFSDFYYCPTHKKIHSDVLAPVKNGRDETIAVLVLRDDPESYVYKLIQSWPTPSRTAETLLVRRDGNSVLFLNELRHDKSRPLTRREPLTKRRLPAVRAVLGFEGPLEGKDYRGVDVLAAVRPIPGTSWYMVAKVDRSEILSDLRYINGAIGAFCLLIFLSAGGSMAFYYSHRQKDTYKQLFKKERELRGAEEEFRATLYSIGDAVMTTDSDGRVRRMNRVAEHITGWAEDEAHGKPLDTVFRIVNEKTRNVVDNPVKKVLSEGRVVGLANHTVLISKGGKEIPIADSGAPIRDEDGATTGVVLVFRDQTEEKRARAALSESEEMYRSLVSASPDAIVVADPGGAITFAAPKALELFGIDPNENVTGYRALNWVAPEDREKAEASIGEVMAGTSPKYREFTFVRNDGSSFFGEVSAALRHGDGASQGIVLIIRDVTERKRAEEEKEKLEEQLRHAQKMEAVGTLAGGVAHDFNNLLTVILGFADLMLLSMGKDDHLRPYIDQIVTSSKRAADLTKDLLAFGRKQRVNLEPHDVNEVTAGAVKLLRRLLPEDIELKMNLSEAHMVARVDVAQLNQVLMNLATNGRDAMPNGGALTIGTRMTTLDETFEKTHGFGKPGAYVLLSVSDTGVGMDEKVMERIFDPFFTTKEVGKGTGLGLASVYGIVKQHGGYITVSSRIAEGTTFGIYLPLVDTGRQRPGLPTGETKGGTETVLVVEDDPDVRNMMIHILRSHGYGTMEAADGEDAMRVYAENGERIALIILDVVMPRRSGKEVLDEIMSINPRVRAIFVSGYTGDVVISKGVESDNVDFLPKPVSVSQLLAKVREVLDR